MRPIKFRAWDKINKRFTPINDIVFFQDGDIRQISTHYMEHGDAEDDNNAAYLEDVILLQYTGLKDKNGLEVYFNDVVEDEYGHRYEVVFEGDCLRCNGIRKIRGGHKPKNRSFGIDLEIIGNRFENPKLLEEEE